MSHPRVEGIILRDVETESDYQLLRRYRDLGCQDSFAEVVRRYTGLVYAAALRQVVDAATAQDVAQVVFLSLARRAGSIGRDVPLSAWLLKATRYTVLALRKAQARRARHERRAAEMAHRANQPAGPRDEDPWRQIEPLLDEALSRLSERIRAAVVLRFFDGMSFDELAGRLGISGETARQRVSRGIAQMRAFFVSRGARVSEAGFVAAVAAHAIPPPPEGLSSVLAAAARINPSAPRLAMMKGAVTFMAWTKAQTIAACAVGLLLVGGGATMAWHSMRVAPQDVIIRPASQSAAVAGDWQASFASAYALSDGQVLRQISPPFIPARQAFWEAEQRKPGGRANVPPLMKQESLVIVWEGQTPHWYSSSMDGGTLDDALWFCANLRPWDLDKSVPRQLKLPGDFSVRHGATADQVMAALAPIVSAKLGRAVRFEKRHVPHEAIVVQGAFRLVPLEGNATGAIIDFATTYPKPPAGPKVRHGTLGQMLNQIKNQLDIRVADETGQSSLPVSWRFDDRWISPDKLLANVSKQTSLTLSRQPREADVWFMVHEPAGGIAVSTHSPPN